MELRSFFAKLVVVLFSIVFTILVWSPGFSAPYLYDDYSVPVADPASQSILAFTHHMYTTLRPLTKLSFAVESELNLTKAPQRRIFEFVLLLVCGLFLFLILQAISVVSQPNWKVSWLMTLFYMTHPLHADEVILLAGRANLLGTACLLTAIYAMILSRRTLSLGFAVLAILARETFLPAALFLVYLNFYKPFSKTVIPSEHIENQFYRWLKFILISTIFVGLTFANLQWVKLFQYSQENVASAQHFGAQFAALSSGLGFIIWPLNLTIDHTFNPLGWERFLLILLSFGFCCFVILRAYNTNKKSNNLAGYFWMLALLLLLPTQSFFAKIDALTERPFISALPMILVALSCEFSNDWYKNIQIKESIRSKLRATGTLILASIILFFAFLSWNRSYVFQDEITIWREAVERDRKTLGTSKNRAQVNLATLLVQKGNYDEAEPLLKQAEIRNPQDLDVKRKLEALKILKETNDLLNSPRN